MMHVGHFHAEAFHMPRDVVTAAARCWRSSRDKGVPVQQCLHELLSPRGCDMLAPVLDSLMALFEAALARRIAVGEGAELSVDEQLLLDLLDGSRPRHACLVCSEGAAHSLDCAICSTRIMMALTLDAPAKATLL